MSRAGLRMSILICAAAASMPGMAACTVSATSVAFNPYNVFDTLSQDITGTVTIRCRPTAAYSLSLSKGSGTFASRTLINGPYALGYNLYIDATRSTVWGDGSSGTSTVSGNDKDFTHTVYGRIPARQNVHAGSYTDTIVVTITY